MVKKLVRCDIGLNVLVGNAAQSIINKHADYLAAGLPVINVQKLPEFGELLEAYHAGMSCAPGDTEALAACIRALASDAALRRELGKNSRRLAEEQFDRAKTYGALVEAVRGGQMTLELLISTMHQDDHALLERMQVQSDAVVVNQCDREGETILEHRGHRVVWIDTRERGLSRSRNMALAHATAELCMLADDDMIYRPGYAETVQAAFGRLDAELIRFRVGGIEKPFKTYPETERRLRFFGSMRAASVELAFRRTALTARGLRFDERIGTGTEFLMGEENALLAHCLRAGLRLCFVPETVADLHMGDSTWLNGHDARFFRGRARPSPLMETPFTALLILQFALRKRALYRNELSTGEAIRQMRRGARLYRERRREHDS